jgi:histidyl-tRNA synthetase
VLAGGRYDKLVKDLGGQESPAVGWALGLERLASLIENKTETGGLYIISDSAMDAQILARKLRQDTNNSITIDYDYNSSKFNKQLERAIKRSYDWALFYMEDERNSGKFKLKNLRETVEYNDLDYDAVVARTTSCNAL